MIESENLHKSLLKLLPYSQLQSYSINTNEKIYLLIKFDITTTLLNICHMVYSFSTLKQTKYLTKKKPIKKIEQINLLFGQKTKTEIRYLQLQKTQKTKYIQKVVKLPFQGAALFVILLAGLGTCQVLEQISFNTQVATN